MPLCEMPSEFPSLQMTKPEKEALSLFSLLLSKIQHKSEKSNVFQNKINEIKHFNQRRSSPQKTERKCFKESYMFYLHKIQSHPFFLFGGTFSFFFFQQKFITLFGLLINQFIFGFGSGFSPRTRARTRFVCVWAKLTNHNFLFFSLLFCGTFCQQRVYTMFADCQHSIWDSFSFMHLFLSIFSFDFHLLLEVHKRIFRLISLFLLPSFYEVEQIFLYLLRC